MRRIAIINQKGGVGKTTTAANLGSALARLGRRVVLLDLDPQANLSLHLGTNLASGEPSTYDLLLGRETLADCLRDTTTAGLQLLPAHIDLSGAELELASAFGREILLREALDTWESASQEAHGEAPADYVILDCPPSLSLLSVNGLAAAHEVIVTLQTEFFALQGISKLVEVIQLIRRRINPALTVAGILPTLYDTRLRLAREVLAEIRRYFPGQVFSRPIRTNVKLAEAPSHGVSIFEYAPNSSGARDYLVPSRVHPGSFYALPQSPQQLKQLLMVAGFEKYFQIARCFRDEDLRADRQPEFTQIDIETSFLNRDSFFGLMEGLMAAIWKETLGIDLSPPFERVPYSEAIERYGTDRPDRRFGMELATISDIAEASGFKVFKGAIEKGGVARAIAGCSGSPISRSRLCRAPGAPSPAAHNAGPNRCKPLV